MADSLTKITSMLESTKALTMAAASTIAQKNTVTPGEVSRLLTSRGDREILLGMKSVISLMARGEDARIFFADVVKNITSTHHKIKCLVMIYLIAYAEVEPDTALLSINSIQRSLNDSNPAVRSRSVRTLAGVKMSSIAPILALSIKRVVADPSPIVRSAAANSISSAFDIDGADRKQLFEFLSKLLSDQDPGVVSAAITTFSKIKATLLFAPKMWAPIHGQYRRFTSILGLMGEWSQITLIDLLVEYARNFLPRPQDQDMVEVESDSVSLVSYDEDLVLFIDLLKPLVHSWSDSVVIAAIKALFCVSSTGLLKDLQFHKALLRVATTSKHTSVSIVAFQLISTIHDKDKTIFGLLYTKFYISCLELTTIQSIKLDILLKLANEENIKYIFEELKMYAFNATNEDIANQAVDAIGFCSQISSEWSQKILGWCLQNIRSGKRPLLLSRILSIMRLLIQQKYQNRNHADSDVKGEIQQLLGVLANKSIVLEGDAKASMIWIIGELGVFTHENFAADALKVVLNHYAQEADSVRYQALILAAKMFTRELARVKELGSEQEVADIENNQISKLYKHTLHLAKYDSNYDTRDRARMIDVLLNRGTDEVELASLFLQAPKPVPKLKSRSKPATETYESEILREYLAVSDWTLPENLPPPSIRKEAPVIGISLSTMGISSQTVMSAAHSSAPTTKIPSSIDKTIEADLTYKLQSLDEFFGGEDESLEEESEEEESEEEESEEEDTGEESDSGESEDEVTDEEEDESEDEEDSDEDELPQKKEEEKATQSAMKQDYTEVDDGNDDEDEEDAKLLN